MDITADYLKANKYTLKCMFVSSIVMVIAWTLNVLKIFIIDQNIMNTSLIGVLIILVFAVIVKFVLGFERSVSNYLMLFFFVGMITFVNMLLSYHVTLFMLFPMVCAILYNKTRYIRYTFALVCVGFFASVLIGYSIGLCDANMLVLTTSTHDKEAARLIAGDFEINSNYILLALFFVLPRIMAFFAFTSSSTSRRARRRRHFTSRRAFRSQRPKGSQTRQRASSSPRCPMRSEHLSTRSSA